MIEIFHLSGGNKIQSKYRQSLYSATNTMAFKYDMGNNLWNYNEIPQQRKIFMAISGAARAAGQSGLTARITA